MRIVIERVKWVRGEGDDGDTCMAIQDGRFCILGHMALALGIGPGALLNQTSPAVLMPPFRKLFPEALFDKEHPHLLSELGNLLLSVNDDARLLEPEREKKLSELLSTIGVEVEFRGFDQAQALRRQARVVREAAALREELERVTKPLKEKLRSVLRECIHVDGEGHSTLEDDDGKQRCRVCAAYFD